MNEIFLTAKEAVISFGLLEWACLVVSGVLSISFSVAVQHAVKEFKQKDFDCFWFFIFLTTVSLICAILVAFPFWAYPADGMFIHSLIWVFLFSLPGYTRPNR